MFEPRATLTMVPTCTRRVTPAGMVKEVTDQMQSGVNMVSSLKVPETLHVERFSAAVPGPSAVRLELANDVIVGVDGCEVSQGSKRTLQETVSPAPVAVLQPPPSLRGPVASPHQLLRASSWPEPPLYTP